MAGSGNFAAALHANCCAGKTAPQIPRRSSLRLHGSALSRAAVISDLELLRDAQMNGLGKPHAA